jgi:purine catabolism regulator
LDSEVSWVHSSDLADPTPFVIPGQVLLTTGTQFGAPAGGSSASLYSGHDSDYDGYAERLAAAGVTGLGFGTDVVRETPDDLAESCLRAGLPLFEVPDRTPFIAVARYVADLVAEQAYARNTWALSAQRAVSLAALHTDGLSATLAELARQLGGWVALVDSSGVVGRVFPARALTASARSNVEAEATRMLRGRRRAASTIVEAGTEGEAGTVVSLQTIGASDRLLGVLAHGGAEEVDQAGQQVVTAVVALAGLALEQGRALESARAAMQGVLLHALENARSLGRELGDPVGLSKAELAGLERLASRVDAARQSAEAAVRASSSEAVRASSSEKGRNSGRRALLAALDGPDARGQASALLAPLIARDPDSVLTESLLVWLEHNGVYDSAARTLGVHRHTLTTRIRTAEQALNLDFGSFADRAEVWAALVALTRTGAA